MLIHCIKKAFSKKNILYVLLFVSIFFAFQDISFAAEATNFETKAIDVLNTLLKIFGSILGAITAFVSIFLHPGWYNGQIFDLNIYLKDIWILMSNVVYFIFAFLLIFIAFMNILGKEGAHHEYQLKTALPKFIVGILIVPFTWFIVQFVLSISAVLTVSVLALPFDTFKDYDFFKSLEKMTICTKYEIPLGKPSSGGSTTSTSTTSTSTDKKIEESIRCIESKNTTVKSIVDSITGTSEGKTSDSIFGIVSIYTYGVLGIEGLDTLGMKGLTSGVTTLTKISLKLVFDIIFVVAYCLLMIALFLALFSRGVWLWIYTMMSPLFGLVYFFGDPHDETLKKFKFTEFISLAMVPVYVAAALSFGLVFIMVAGDGMRKSVESKDQTGKIMTCTAGKEGTDADAMSLDGAATNAPNCEINIGDFSFRMTGVLGDASNIFGGSMGALGTLIVQMFGLVILWLSVMAALHASKITEQVAHPIAHIGESIGSTMMKMPQYAPILPGGMSTKGLDSAVGAVTGSFETNANKKGSDLAYKHFGDFMGGPKQKEVTDKMIPLQSSIANANLAASHSRDLLGALGSAEEIAKNAKARELIANQVIEHKMLKLDPTATKALMDQFKGADTPTKVQEVFKKMEEESKAGLSLLGGENTIENINSVADFNKALAASKGSSSGGSAPTGTGSISDVNLNQKSMKVGNTTYNVEVTNNKITKLGNGPDLAIAKAISDSNFKDIEEVKKYLGDNNISESVLGELDKYFKDGIFDSTGKGNGKLFKK